MNMRAIGIWRALPQLGLLWAVGFLFSGCVVLAEKYEAEKARSLNFQRLLAQEEKRSAELDSEVKRTKREYSDVEAKNRELTAQVQAVREQMGRLQEEAEAMKQAALMEKKAREDMKRTAAAAKSLKVESPTDLADLTTPPPAETAVPDKTIGTYHVVRPGETLYRISKKYGVDVDRLKKWNKLPDDIIEVGQKLIVGQV
jgi:LysM repeat protein